MHTLAPRTSSHALPRVQVRSRAPGQARSRAASCKTASRKNSSLSRLNSNARCAPAQTAPRETALFLGASASGALVLRFPGQYADSETGSFYNYFRTYDPRIRGGYIQPDPIGLAGGWNRFNYSYSNALRFTDPTGEIVISPVTIALGIGALGAIIVNSQNNNSGRPSTSPTGVPEQSWPTFPPFNPTDTPDANKEAKDKCFAAYEAQIKVCQLTSSTPTARQACYARATNEYADCIKKNCR